MTPDLIPGPGGPDRRPTLQSSYKPPKGLGYFINILSRLDDWIARENHRGADIPRFTQNQVRRIALYLERDHLFNFDRLRTDRTAGHQRSSQDWDHTSLRNGVPDKTLSRWDDRMPQMTLRASSAPGPVAGRARPTYDDQVREFKRLVLEEKREVPSSVMDQLLEGPA